MDNVGIFFLLKSLEKDSMKFKIQELSSTQKLLLFFNSNLIINIMNNFNLVRRLGCVF